MVQYSIVKHCFGCRKRFVVDKGESKKNYCDACQERYYKERDQEDRDAKKDAKKEKDKKSDKDTKKSKDTKKDKDTKKSKK